MNSLSENNRQNSPEQQEEILFSQNFQCKCLMKFKTIQEYQKHIIDDNHQFHPTISGLNQTDDNQINFTGYPSQTQTLKKVNYTHHLQPFNQGNNIQVEMKSAQNQFKNYFNQMKFPQQNQFSGAQRLQSEQKFPNNHQNTEEQKQDNFKYIEAYYRSKLDPFYREFDIDPQKTMSSQRSSQQQKNSEQQYLNYQTQNNSAKIIQQNISKDMGKFLDQLNVRMIPVQNGIIDFLQNFINENYEKFLYLTRDDVNMIQKKLQNSLMQFKMMSDETRSNRITVNQEFLESDLDLALRMFCDFLKQILRPKQIWIANLMLLAVLSKIKSFYLSHQNQLQENLKISEISFILDKISGCSQLQKFDCPISINTQTTCQFLMWFCQWSTMVQYIKNKTNINYVQPLLDTINQINELYRQNVIGYQKCIQNKKQQLIQRTKRKAIQKQKNRRKRIEFIQRQKAKYLRSNRLMTVNNLNREKQVQNEYFNSSYFEKPRETSFLNNIQAINRYSHNQMRNEDFEKIDIIQNNQIPFIQQKQQIEYSVDGLYKINQKNLQTPLTKKNKNDDQIASESSIQQSPNSQKGQQDNFTYPAVTQSKFVSYFSKESEQIRKKEEQQWKIKLKRIKYILANNNEFKSFMKTAIEGQLQQVKQLTSFFFLNSKIFKFSSKTFYNKNYHLFYKPEIPLNTIQSQQLLISSSYQIQNQFRTDNFSLQKEERTEKVVKKQQREQKQDIQNFMNLQNEQNIENEQKRYMDTFEAQRYRQQKNIFPKINQYKSSNARKIDQLLEEKNRPDSAQNLLENLNNDIKENSDSFGQFF